MNPPAGERETLREGARALGLDLAEEVDSKLLAYLDLLYRWNASTGLTSVERSEAVRLHLLDSLSVLPSLGEAERVVDLGSGGGLPGLPIALARQDLRVVLVESRRRACSFLEEACRELGLGRCTVARRRAEELAAEGLSFDAVLSRAFLAPARFVELAQGLVRPGGRVIVMASKRPKGVEEVAGGLGLIEKGSRCFVLPGGNETRQILVFERTQV